MPSTEREWVHFRLLSQEAILQNTQTCPCIYSALKSRNNSLPSHGNSICHRGWSPTGKEWRPKMQKIGLCLSCKDVAIAFIIKERQSKRVWSLKVLGPNSVSTDGRSKGKEQHQDLYIVLTDLIRILTNGLDGNKMRWAGDAGVLSGGTGRVSRVGGISCLRSGYGLSKDLSSLSSLRHRAWICQPAIWLSVISSN